MISLALRFASSLFQLHNDNIRLCKQGDPMLRQPARELSNDEINTEDFKTLVDRMVQIMQEHGGQGLAAPQVGIDVQLIVFQFTEDDYQNALKCYGKHGVQKREMRVFPLTVLVNPKMKVSDFNRTVFEEGCLSLQRTVGKVERYKTISVEGLNEHGEIIQFNATGWMARILQHEIHHLKGILISDCFVKMKSRHWFQR